MTDWIDSARPSTVDILHDYEDEDDAQGGGFARCSDAINMVSRFEMCFVISFSGKQMIRIRLTPGGGLAGGFGRPSEMSRANLMAVESWGGMKPRIRVGIQGLCFVYPSFVRPLCIAARCSRDKTEQRGAYRSRMTGGGIFLPTAPAGNNQPTTNE